MKNYWITTTQSNQQCVRNIFGLESPQYLKLIRKEYNQNYNSYKKIYIYIIKTITATLLSKTKLENFMPKPRKEDRLHSYKIARRYGTPWHSLVQLYDVLHWQNSVVGKKKVQHNKELSKYNFHPVLTQ